MQVNFKAQEAFCAQIRLDICNRKVNGLPKFKKANYTRTSDKILSNVVDEYTKGEQVEKLQLLDQSANELYKSIGKLIGLNLSAPSSEIFISSKFLEKGKRVAIIEPIPAENLGDIKITLDYQV